MSSPPDIVEPVPAGPEPLDPALIRLALVILVGALAAILDLTIVNVAIDTLQRRLHAGVSTIQWVSTGYTLAASMTIPVSGWAFERFGARGVWIASLVLFVSGSVLCGLAWSVGSLIAFRILQGVGGGMLIPLAQTILASAAGRERMARIMPFIAIPAQLGPVLGPVIGGLIVSNASWRWIFYVNVPVCAVAIALAWRSMPQTEIRRDHRLDLRGLALLSPALALIVYGFSEAGTAGGYLPADRRGARDGGARGHPPALDRRLGVCGRSRSCVRHHVRLGARPQRGRGHPRRPPSGSVHRLTDIS